MSVLHLVRYAYTPDETLGLLKFPVQEDGSARYGLWTVETKWNMNLPFMSCIPDGTYQLQAFESAKHPESWVITPCEGRTGILIHSGNDFTDVCGCIAPGLTRSGVKVWESRDAMRLLNYELSRNEIHSIVIGSGLGAVMPLEDGQRGGGDVDPEEKPESGRDSADHSKRAEASRGNGDRDRPAGGSAGGL